mgnify:FL=1
MNGFGVACLAQTTKTPSKYYRPESLVLTPVTKEPGESSLVDHGVVANASIWSHRYVTASMILTQKYFDFIAGAQ